MTTYIVSDGESFTELEHAQNYAIKAGLDQFDISILAEDGTTTAYTPKSFISSWVANGLSGGTGGGSLDTATSNKIDTNTKQIGHRVLIVDDFYAGSGTPSGNGVFTFSDLTNPIVTASVDATLLSQVSAAGGQVSIEVLPTGNTFLRAEVEGNIIAHKGRGLMHFTSGVWTLYSEPVAPDVIGGTVTGVSIALNAAKTGYEFSYTYTNPAGGTTGGTPIVTWGASDQADGAGATQISAATTYMPTGVNRYKYLVGTLVVQASTGEKTTAETVVIYPGFSTEVLIPTGGTRFGVRSRHTGLSFDGKLWVIGGYDGSNKNDVWSSTDGADWTQVTANAGFTARRFHASVVYNNKMWVVGGYTDQSMTDVWSSSDGIAWTQVTANGGFGEQHAHKVVSHNGSMFLMASNTSDVWSSSDGIAWTQLTTTSVYSARTSFTSVIHNNKIFVIGGLTTDGTSENDVWSSSDGIAWTQVTANGGFGASQLHSSAVLDGKIFTLMGTPNKNDVWASTDGATWTQVTTGGFTARQRSAVVVKDNKIFILGGDDGRFKNDVWY